MELSYSLLPTDSPSSLDLLLIFRTDPPKRQQRQGLGISMVIDKSGSMSGAPIRHATQAAELLVRQLGGNDTLSVVAYDDHVDTVVPPQSVTDATAIARTIRKIRVGGCTALHAGWKQGCTLLNTDTHSLRRVLLLTDGQANSGITDPKTLMKQAREWAAQGIVTTTLGFGIGFNEDLLIGMAEAGGGNFYYIETPQDATQVFLIEGESLTTISAWNLTLELIPRPGVGIGEVLNRAESEPGAGGSLKIRAGEVYGGEDKRIAVRLEVPDNWEGPLLDIRYHYQPVVPKPNPQAEISISRSANAPDPDDVREMSRIHIARSKEEAVRKADSRDFKGAAAALGRMVERLKAQKLDEEFEIAEEAAQLEYFAGTIQKGHLNVNTRKILLDQSYQGRSRSRNDLNARGSSGGSASGLPVAKSQEGKVELVCQRLGGKLKLAVVSPGYDPSLPVLFPRNLRQENVHYVVDKLEPSENGTFYRTSGSIQKLSAEAATPVSGGGGDLALDALFEGGGEPWLPLLKPTLQAQADIASFLGPNRDSAIVPVRELTFQALKPNPPEEWKVVVFGQNPYPRVESATGIAMFDNTFSDWKDSQFGKVTSIRCIIKAAAMNKYGIARTTSVADIRALLAQNQVVQPPAWFQAMLTQGVLLLNAALTATSKGDPSETSRHTTFWKPIVEKIVEEILKSRQEEGAPGVVFAWWGAHAKALRQTVEKLQKKYPKIKVKHVDHCNPAAQGDIFCDNDPFGAINTALKSLGMKEIDWLPTTGWDQTEDTSSAEKMGSFITQTRDLHQQYLKRLQEVLEEARVELGPITGILSSSPIPLSDAMQPLVGLISGLSHYVQRAVGYGNRKVNQLATALDEHEIAAIYLYTCETSFYSLVNGALRNPDRSQVQAFAPYLRLLLSGLQKLTVYTGELWRAVAADLRPQYPKGATITWWGVSSCTARLSVAHAFLGNTGKRTLFEIRASSAVGVRSFSAFTGEDEYMLAPGTRLLVVDVQTDKSGLCTITLQEIEGERGVS